MEPVIHASILIGIVLLTIFIIYRYGHVPPRMGIIILESIILILLCGSILLPLLVLNSVPGNYHLKEPFVMNASSIVPYRQILIPVLCMTALMIAMSKRYVRILVFIIFIGIMLGLRHDLYRITNRSSQYTVRPDYIETLSKASEKDTRRRSLLTADSTELVNDYNKNNFYHYKANTEWYTPVTGIYSISSLAIPLTPKSDGCLIVIHYEDKV